MQIHPETEGYERVFRSPQTALSYVSGSCDEFYAMKREGDVEQQQDAIESIAEICEWMQKIDGEWPTVSRRFRRTLESLRDDLDERDYYDLADEIVRRCLLGIDHLLARCKNEDHKPRVSYVVIVNTVEAQHDKIAGGMK